MSKSITISLTDSARAVVTLETKGSRIVYSRYISDHGVTLDTVGEHVAALAELAVSLRAVDGDDKPAVKNFKNKVRNGLNSNLGKVVPSKDDAAKWLMTTDGLAAFAALDKSERESFLVALAAEAEKRAK